jgi:hypothetical protein
MTTGRGLRAEPAGGYGRAVWYLRAGAGDVRLVTPNRLNGFPLNSVPQRDGPHAAPSRLGTKPQAGSHTLQFKTLAGR